MTHQLFTPEIPIHETIEYMRREEGKVSSRFNSEKFETAKRSIDAFFEQRLSRAGLDEKKEMLRLQHRAVRYEPDAVESVKRIIRQQIEEQRMQDVPIPGIYEDLTDALYHETFGLGAVSVWFERNRHIGKCRVNGLEIRYRKPNDEHRLHEQYGNMKSVQRMIENLLRNDEGEVISRDKNYAQFSLFDGTRVTIALPPTTKSPTVVFRRATVQHYSMKQQAAMETIFEQAIPIYTMLARCGIKMIITGEPATGKTTFLISLFGETKSNKVTVVAEHVFEGDFKNKFPERDITEFSGDEKTLVPVVFPLSLRMDTQQYIMQEIREIEASMFKEACANTRGLVMATMHERDATNVPATLARKELRHSEGLNFRVSMSDFANQIDFAMVMEFGEDDLSIINTEITALVLNPHDLSVTSNRIMWHDGEKWTFNADIEPRLAKRMRKYDRVAFDEGMEMLKQLAISSPMPEEEKSVTLAGAV